MIEKIWKLTEKGITDDNGKVGSLEEVVNVLNDYHFILNDYLRENNKLREENEGLKKENKELRKYMYHAPQILSILLKENEVIKEDYKHHISELQGQIDTQKLINKSLKINEEYNKKAIQKLTVQKLEIRKWINDKISYLEKKYEFGQTEYKGCPMHNIQFGINILKELREYWEEQEND